MSPTCCENIRQITQKDYLWCMYEKIKANFIYGYNLIQLEISLYLSYGDKSAIFLSSFLLSVRCLKFSWVTMI